MKLDGEPITGDSLDLDAGQLDGRVLQVGKRRFRRLRTIGLGKRAADSAILPPSSGAGPGLPRA